MPLVLFVILLYLLSSTYIIIFVAERRKGSHVTNHGIRHPKFFLIDKIYPIVPNYMASKMKDFSSSFNFLRLSHVFSDSNLHMIFFAIQSSSASNELRGFSKIHLCYFPLELHNRVTEPTVFECVSLRPTGEARAIRAPSARPPTAPSPGHPPPHHTATPSVAELNTGRSTQAWLRNIVKMIGRVTVPLVVQCLITFISFCIQLVKSGKTGNLILHFLT